jgi:YNFM family putative membrane transporter
LFFLYVGSSVLGWAGGIAWSRAKWIGVAAFTGVLMTGALLVGLRLVAVKPLPENEVPPAAGSAPV